MSATSPVGTRSVLVVDDHAPITELISTWLEEAGYRVACASSGISALWRLRNEVFDVVITDIVMPDMDGLELIRATRDLPVRPYFIAISGGGYRLTRESCLSFAQDLGAAECLAKPFDRDQMLLAVQRAG